MKNISIAYQSIKKDVKTLDEIKQIRYPGYYHIEPRTFKLKIEDLTYPSEKVFQKMKKQKIDLGPDFETVKNKEDIIKIFDKRYTYYKKFINKNSNLEIKTHKAKKEKQQKL